MRTHPDQTRPLIGAVLSALSAWPQYLDIITRLASVEALRNLILELEPNLLSRVTDEATGARSPDAISVKAVCSLLSTPLPHHVPLPASAQTLLVNLVEEISRKPTKSTLTQVYAMISGGCNPIIPILSIGTLQRFEKTVFKVLRDASNAEQQANSLMCLCIMKSLLEVGEYRTNWHSWDRSAMIQFFHGCKAAKTLHLAALQAVWICGEGRTSEDAVFNMSITSEVIDGVAREVKASWCHTNGQIMQKLCDRATTVDLPDQLRMVMFSLICTLCSSADSMHMSVITTFGKLITNINSVQILDKYLDVALKNTVRHLIPRIADSFIPSYLEATIILLGDTHVEAGGLIRTAKVLQALSDAVLFMNAQQISRLRIECLPSLHSVVEKLNTIDAGVSKSTYHSGISLSKLELSKAMRSFLLATALYGARHGLSWPPDLIKGLMTPLRETGRKHHLQGLALPPVGVAVSVQRQSTFDRTLPWKDSLDCALQKQSAVATEHVRSIVHQVCGELEARCLDAEKPLQKEKAKVSELQRRCDELEEAFGQLESDLVDRDLQLSEMETQARAYSNDLDASENSRKDLLERVGAAEAQLREEVTKVHEQLNEALQREEHAVVSHQSEKSQLQEELARLEKLAGNKNQEIATLTSDFAHANEESSLLAGQLKNLRDSHDQLRSQLESQGQQLSAADRDLQISISVQDDLRREVESQKKANLESTRKSESLIEELKDIRNSTERERQDFIAQYQSNAIQARTEWESTKRQLEARIELLEKQQAEKDQAHDEAAFQVEEKCRHQARQIAQLKKRCATRDSELAAAQEMRNKLMSAMGIVNQQPQPEPLHSTLPIRSLSSTANPEPSNGAGIKEALDDDMFDESFASIDLEYQNRSPARQRETFKAPKLSHPREASRRRSRRSIQSPVKDAREVLAPSSVNVSPARKTPGKVAFKDVQEDLRLVEGWSFTTDVITSTPGIGLGGGGIEDDTTVEI